MKSSNLIGSTNLEEAGFAASKTPRPQTAGEPGAKIRGLFAPARLAPTETADKASIFAAKPVSSKLALSGE